MKVEPYEGLTRFLVTSDVNPENQYLVDVDQYGGIGFCGCMNFRFRIETELCKPGGVANAKRDPDSFRCKHILAARKLLGRELVDALVKKNINDHKAQKARAWTEKLTSNGQRKLLTG